MAAAGLEDEVTIVVTLTDALEEAGGITDCGNAQNCVKVCPKHIPLTESISAMGRAVTIHNIAKFFTGRK